MSKPLPVAPSARPASALAAATVASLPLGSIYAFSVLLAPLEQLLAASRSDLASVFGISVVSFTVGANVAPRLFGRISAPALLLLTMALAAGGVVIAAGAASLFQLIFGYGVLFSLGGGLAYVVVQQCVNAAPTTRPGLVNGYLVSLFPLGAMIAAPAFGLGLATIGVRETLLALALVVAVAGLVATEMVLHSRVRLTKSSASQSAATGDQPVAKGVFLKLFTVFFLAAAAGLMVLSQVAAIVVAYGASQSVALAATTAITAAIAAARLTGGFLVDRWPIPVVAAAAQGLALAGAAVLTLWPSAATAIVSLGLIGIGYGLVSGVTVGAVASYWPKAMFGRIASRTYIAWCFAALTLPVLAAHLFVTTGGYGGAVIVAGAANLLAVLVSLTLPRQRQSSSIRAGGPVADAGE